MLQVQMGVNFNCKVAGDPVKLDSEKRKQFEEKIREEYVVHLYVFFAMYFRSVQDT